MLSFAVKNTAVNIKVSFISFILILCLTFLLRIILLNDLKQKKRNGGFKQKARLCIQNVSCIFLSFTWQLEEEGILRVVYDFLLFPVISGYGITSMVIRWCFILSSMRFLHFFFCAIGSWTVIDLHSFSTSYPTIKVIVFDLQQVTACHIASIPPYFIGGLERTPRNFFRGNVFGLPAVCTCQFWVRSMSWIHSA